MEFCTAKLLWVTDTHRNFLHEFVKQATLRVKYPAQFNIPQIHQLLSLTAGFLCSLLNTVEFRVTETSCVGRYCGKNKLLFPFIMQMFYTRLLHADFPFQELRKIAKKKKTVSFVMSVCLSVRMGQLGSHWKDFREIWHLSIV